MSLSEKDVNHVARLSRLALSDEERSLYREQLGRILDYVAQLDKYKTDDVPPTSHVVPLSNVLREDKAKPWTDNESILANAPDREDNYFRVKKVIE